MGILLDSNSDRNYVHDNDFFINEYAFECSYSRYNNFTGNLLDDNVYSIELSEAHYNEVHNNVLKNNTYGINIDQSSNNNITGNMVEYSNSQHGILISKCRENLVAYNRVNTCRYGIFATAYAYNDGLHTIRDNKIQSCSDIGLRVYISSYNVVKGNSITGNSEAGIYMQSTQYNKLLNNNVSSNSVYGIYMEYSHFNSIKNSVISYNSQTGTYIYDSHNNELIDNRIDRNWGFNIIAVLSDNTDIISNDISNSSSGLYLEACEGTLLENNELIGNWMDIRHISTTATVMRDNELAGGGLMMNGYYEGEYSSHKIDTTNTVDGRPILYWNGKSGGTVPGGVSQVILASCYGVTVKGQEIRNITHGITLAYSNKCIIEDNVISGSIDRAITTYSSNENMILNNTITRGSNNGLYFEGGSYDNIIRNNIIANNTVTGIIVRGDTQGNNIDDNLIEWNGYDGIEIYSSYYHAVTNNTIRNNGRDGVYLIYADDNLVNNNTFYANKNDGVDLDRADSSTISNNTFIHNYAGVRIEYSYNNMIYTNSFRDHSLGMTLSHGERNVMTKNTYIDNSIGIKFYYADHNLLYHNNFINNEGHVDGEASPNRWNLSYPDCGNYWDTYTGIDENHGKGQNDWGSDGIGDVPYIVDHQNTDRYPLMEPYSSIMGPPSPPVNFKARVGKGFIHLTWEPPESESETSIIEYRIYKDHAITIKGSRTYEIIYTEGKTTSYNDTRVSNGEPYVYKISAVNRYGEGDHSNEIYATPGSVPDRPGSLIAITDDDKVQLTWNAPAFNGGSLITGYRLYKGVASGVLTLYKELGPVFYFTDTNISIGVSYYYRVSAVNSFGESPMSNEVSALVATVPSAPLNLTLKIGDISGDLYFYLDWNPPASDGGWPIKKYYVYRGETDDELEPIERFCMDTFYNDTDVSADILYYYKITAVNGMGEGAESTIIAGIRITPENKLPRALISASVSSGKAPLTVYFNGTGIDYDGEIVKYIWDLGDTNTSTDQNVVHTYAVQGMYYVKLTVIDDAGGSAFTMITITVTGDTVPPPEDIVDDGKKEDKKESSAYLMGAIAASIAGLVVILLLLFLNWSAIMARPKKEEEPVERERPRYAREIEVTRIQKIARPKTIPLVDAEVAIGEGDTLDDDELMEE
jgi:parallel beta-helix repeat protein